MVKIRLQRSRRKSGKRPVNYYGNRKLQRKKEEILRAKQQKLVSGRYVVLDRDDFKHITDKNFQHSQKYISSLTSRYNLYYYSKEEIFDGLDYGKIMITKIKRSFFEKAFLKITKGYFIDHTIKRNQIFICSKYLYLVKK